MVRFLTPMIRGLVPPTALDRLWRRVMKLLAGLVLYGVSDSLLVLAHLGIDPWDVFQQGIALHTGVPIGTWAILVGIAVLFLWIPLRQRPGLGTLLNVLVVGGVMDLVLANVTPPTALPVRITVLLLGVGLNGVATGWYIGAGLGPGPRDGLMVGLAARGLSIRLVRTSIEVTVLIVGWMLGGNVGWGTLLYALSIGPLAQIFIPLFTMHPLKGADSPIPAPPPSGQSE
ncbi:membrane protein YczE [Alicyclobacillus sp. ALC3]|uniref:membrane protein YczE n=1 Tax=Alicyclobacillus sp. ALC3 TaxID=2796143 RepID=UPI0023782087|nr:YitT family protein [Alicyclobacillus sp. ALC3]WDL98393.1 YitT family protein [Alicyclobacillus sp. ALC3]